MTYRFTVRLLMITLAAMLVVMFLTLGFMTNICLALFDNQVLPAIVGG